MKLKLKEIDFEKLVYSLNNGIFGEECKMINYSYQGSEFEFQTPKVIIEKIIKENSKEYLLLKILGTEACRTFYSKISELEDTHNSVISKHNEWFNNSLPIGNVKSVFKGQTFLVKVPFKYSSPNIKIYKDSRLFNYYHLKEGMEIICLLGCNNLWINFDNNVSYHLILKEIMITK